MIMKKEALREYRKRNVVFWVLFLGWVPVIMLVAIPLGRMLNSNVVTETLITAWFMGVVAATIWRLRWECPRCSKPFYTKWYHNAFATKCVYCGYRPGT